MKKRLLIHPEELSEKWVDRMKETGVDVLALHPVGGSEARYSWDRLFAALETAEFRRLLDYAVKQGLEVEYEIHSVGSLLERTLFSRHPEYFRMNQDGVRTPDWNLCVSQPEALEIVADNAQKAAEKLYRTTNCFYFWVDDTKDSCCCCERCRALSPSDQQLMIVNRIARRLRSVRPDAKVAYLAYVDRITPPQKVKPEEGVFLEYAPIERDRSKCASSMPQTEKDNIHALLDFFGRKDARVLEYWYDNSLFSNWTKPPVKFVPNNVLIREDMKFYAELGFEQIGSFACYLGQDYEALHGEPDLTAFTEKQ